MLRIHYETEIHVPVQDVWSLFCNIPGYVQHVAFVKKVVGPSEFKEGVEWYDITTVLWIPLRVYHRITTIKKYYLRFDLRGIGIKHEVEEIRLTPLDMQKTHVTMDITLDLGGFFNFILGNIVQKRLLFMCDKTARDFEAWFFAQHNIKNDIGL